MCSSSIIIKQFLRSSLGVISPQDAGVAQQDVMENYNLRRPQALDGPRTSGPISLHKQRGGNNSPDWELMKTLKGRRKGETLITSLTYSYILGEIKKLKSFIYTHLKLQIISVSFFFIGLSFKASLCLRFNQQQVSTLACLVYWEDAKQRTGKMKLTTAIHRTFFWLHGSSREMMSHREITNWCTYVRKSSFVFFVIEC